LGPARQAGGRTQTLSYTVAQHASVGSTEASEDHLTCIRRGEHWPHQPPPDRSSSVASRRRDILVERRPGDADRFASFVNRVFLLPVQINGHGTLFLAELFSPAAFPAPRPRRGEPCASFHPVAARVKKTVAAYRSGFFRIKLLNERSSKENRRILLANSPQRLLDQSLGKIGVSGSYYRGLSSFRSNSPPVSLLGLGQCDRRRIQRLRTATASRWPTR
jgi:hypothetical protein